MEGAMRETEPEDEADTTPPPLAAKEESVKRPES